VISRIALCALAASCAAPEPPVEAAPPHWVYPPPAPVWQLGELKGRFGRSQAPQRPLAAGITGDVFVPLRLATPWAVPGDGPVRAIVSGLEGARPAVELIEVDRGHVMWRDTAVCAGPVVGVIETAVVCADDRGTRALGLDGKPRWKTDAKYVAMTDGRVVVAGIGEAIVVDADDGKELTRVKLPPGVSVETIIASCGEAGRELFALGRDGKLARIAEVTGRAGLTWAVAVGEVRDLDPCTGDSIVVTTADSAVIAVSRKTGKLTGRVEGVRGHWHARDGSDRLEIATRAGVDSWPRDLVGPPLALPLPPLGELLDARGDRRLVRASPLTAVLLDRDGVHAYLPFAPAGAVLGGASITGASWAGSPGETVRRIGIPARTRRVLRVPPRRAGVALPAELRDLPVAITFDPAGAIAKPDTGKHAVTAIVLDPLEPAVLYAVALEDRPDELTAAAIASVDLAKREWRWQRADGCGPGTPLALALARDVVVCVARGTLATVRATSRDGAARWQWETDNADVVQAAGEAVLVYDADRLTILDAATGRVRGRFTSDDGAAVRASVLATAGAEPMTWLVIFEHGRLVARLPGAGMLAVWSLRVDGVVRGISPSADGVLVELEDGDAYRVDVRTAEVTAMPGLGLAWAASGELVTGQITGGPIPGLPRPAPVRAFPPLRYRRPVPPPVQEGRNPEPPTLWIPIQPPLPLGDSWQYTLYNLTGGLRARNDYALTSPVAPAVARGPKGSPLVVAYGPGLREVIVLDPRTGDPLRRVLLPEGAPPGLVFGTIVDGTPVAGALLASPLRAVLF